MTETPSVECHPWEPWLPVNARVLIMGTFPPGAHRWSMDFYYPNPTNDFWRIVGLILLGDKEALYNRELKRFNLEAIKEITSRYGIAMSDTVKKAIRMKGNASDKFLEVVEANDPVALLEKIPSCRDIATTGEKAATVVADISGTPVPKMGEYSIWNAPGDKGVRIWRMPSTSRAYPLNILRKAEYYRTLFEACGIF